MTPVCALVADLQDSCNLSAELPPAEYFELINEVWGSLGPIFKKYYGTHGKHAGDGVVYYFLPKQTSSYIFNAIVCATEIRERVGQLSEEWKQRKNWLNELYLNIGLNEGRELMGSFETPQSVGLTVLDDTINHAGRLSDFS